jgi:tetratricopeptide (TPR) repeat protein
MFLVRLRKGSRWVFVAIIFAFAFTFLFAGVGSGSGDIIQQLLGMRGTNPITSAEGNVAKHPHNAVALMQLAQAYDGKQLRGPAMNTYVRYLKLKPKDTSALAQLGNLQQQVAALRFDRYSGLQSELSIATGPLSSDPLQTLAGTDSLLSTYVSLQTSRVSSAYGSYLTAATTLENTYKRYAQAVPMKATLQRAQVELELAQAASGATHYKTAIASYELYLKLNPTSPLKPQIKKVLGELRKLPTG